MKLIELASSGTYAALKFDSKTTQELINYLKDKDVPNPVDHDDLHCTLLFSEKPCPDYEAAGDLEEPHEVSIKTPHVWKTQSGKNCLVFELHAPSIVERHEFLRKTHGATHSFPSYIPHFTLSYDVPDGVKAKSYDDLKELIPVIRFDHEYKKELEL